MPQLMQSLVDWLTKPAGEVAHFVFRSEPRMPMFAASQVPFPTDKMWLKIRLKPAVIWLMLRAEKIWFSDTVTLRPWLLMCWLLANAFCSANPGAPPGTYELA